MKQVPATEATLKSILGMSSEEASAVSSAIVKARRSNDENDVTAALELALEFMDGFGVEFGDDAEESYVDTTADRTLYARQTAEKCEFYIGELK